ncbi:MAG: hypothetical protein WCJ29_02710 [bacterium]
MGLRIGLDLDGVIMSHREAKQRLAVLRGFSLEPWQTNANVLRHHLPDAEYQAIQKIIYGDATLAAPPVSGALESIIELSRTPGIELYLISARRTGIARDSAITWLRKQSVIDYIPEERMIFVERTADKPGPVEALQITHFLDDSLDALEPLPRNVAKYFFDEDGVTPNLGKSHDFSVVESWSEFVRDVLIAVKRND